MGIDYVVIGFDMEVQLLVTHNAAWPLGMSALCIDVMSNHLLFAHMSWAYISYSHTGLWALLAQI